MLSPSEIESLRQKTRQAMAMMRARLQSQQQDGDALRPWRELTLPASENGEVGEASPRTDTTGKQGKDDSLSDAHESSIDKRAGASTTMDTASNEIKGDTTRLEPSQARV